MSTQTPEFSVLIPERGRPQLLAHTLASLAQARRELQTLHRVHVLVNGAPANLYRALQVQYQDVQWHFCARALGYHGAIAALLKLDNAPWVYLLNSDMALAADALQQVLAWRSPEVFAIGSQIDFVDPNRRREESGFTAGVRAHDGQLELHDLIAPDDTVRSTLYVSGGAGLFQRQHLLKYLPASRAYRPFYFEDADWGMQAWAAGLLSLYCPTSRALHVHRGTIAHYYTAPQIDRVVRRNLGFFRWRYGDLFALPRWHEDFAARARALLLALRWSHRKARATICANEIALPPGSARFLHLQRFSYPLARHLGKPRVLLCTPFAPLPPTHGGARRVLELCRASSAEIDWLLLHDEGTSEPIASGPDDAVFCSITTVNGRPERGCDCWSRWTTHAHPMLRSALHRQLQQLRPDVVCLEHLESLELIETLPAQTRVIWTLHDASRELPAAARARVQQALARVDCLVLTTQQDIGYWQHPRQVLVENGVHLPVHTCASPEQGVILLMAPQRYPPNQLALQRFLQQAWPTLRANFPGLRLRVLIGPGGQVELPEVNGVELIHAHMEPALAYADALLAINPQQDIEGSAVKIAEALAHRRVMVTTVAGARGYEQVNSDALQRVTSMSEMANMISELLTDPARRRHLEAQGPAAIAGWSWQLRVRPLLAAIRSLMPNNEEVANND